MVIAATMPQTNLPPITEQTQDKSPNHTSTTNNQQQEPKTDGNDEPTPTSDRLMLELRKYILLLATLVATVTYAAGFSPPGDVWQDTTAGHLAGEPIIRDTHYRRYLVFFYCNATAFAASVVVIVLILILSSLDDRDESRSRMVSLYKDNPWVAVRPLQVFMVLDLLSLMGAYAAGTCRDTFTKAYSSLLVGIVFVYLVAQMAVASRFGSRHTGVGLPPAAGNGGRKNTDSISNDSGTASPPSQVVDVVDKQQEQDLKAQERLRKVLMLLATFAVSITYVAGLSTPGGFWGSAGPGHRPGDAILKDHHNTRLAVFFSFNTLAFVSSLLIIVVLLDRKLRWKYAYGFIVVALVSLGVAYTAGSCRQTDTTVYVISLFFAVAVYFGFLELVVWVIDSRWNITDKAKKENKEKTEKEKAADKARSLVLLLATLAATITYQAGLVPPGGVWQDNGGGHMAGDPILLTTNRRRYKAFFYCNSVAFVASLVAIVMVQLKSLLTHHVLEVVMILDLLGLIGSYAAGSCRDVTTSIYAMALAGAVLVYVVIHVIFITLDDRTGRGNTGKDDDDECVERTRKRLLLFAILAATITYQAGFTPPGGFLQGDLQSGHHAGDPVLLYNFPRRYKAFFYCNSVSFMLSIALILLLVNPNLYRPAIRSHALSVCTAAGLFALMGAYAAGSTQHLKTSIYIFVLVAVVLLLIVVLFLLFFYTDDKRKDERSKKRQGARDNRNTAQHSSNIAQGARKDDHSNGGSNTAQGAAMEANNNTKDKDKRIHAKRKYLMLLGILVASVTYQAGLEPPGGAWQASGEGYEAGNPVMHDNRRIRYLAFFYSNSTSFMASIVVILLLLIPKKQIGEGKSLTRWLVVMSATVVLDLLGLLGAYAAGSSRRWKTSVYVLVLVIAVLAYMAFHLMMARFRPEGNQGTEQNSQGQVHHDDPEVGVRY